MEFSINSILIDPEREAENIIEKIKFAVPQVLKKRGAVIGVSGGVDSSACLALTVKALGSEKVLALLLPERESSEENIPLVEKLLEKYKVESIVEDLTGALEGIGCYRRRDEAVKNIFPEYDSSYKMKIILPQPSRTDNKLNLFYLEIISPSGKVKRTRLPLKEYLQIVAASNFKQRTRMSMLYHYAELNNYAVIGTANKNEYEQGFFVKFGDSGSDIKPICHLFKTQVYQLAGYLNIPGEIINRRPTSDTYSAEQTQEEFFFKLPFDILDRIWFGWEKNIPVEQIARTLSLNEELVQNVIKDTIRKKNTTEYLRKEPLNINSIDI
jgi:NAD+ synthase